jgi:hypothetical protein
LDEHGDVQCLSGDGENCSWFINEKDCDDNYDIQMSMPNVQDITCGDKHKAKFGNSGYDNPLHWCSIIKAFLEKT